MNKQDILNVLQKTHGIDPKFHTEPANIKMQFDSEEKVRFVFAIDAGFGLFVTFCI